MNRATFDRIMEPVRNYYHRWAPSREVMDFYFRELGGMTERDLERALEHHMANFKSEPLVSHLRGKGAAPESASRPQPIHQHPEWTRHWCEADAMLSDRLGEHTHKDRGETFLFPVKPLVDEAMEVYESFDTIYKDDESKHRSKASAARGTLNLLLLSQFKALRAA